MQRSRLAFSVLGVLLGRAAIAATSAAGSGQRSVNHGNQPAKTPVTRLRDGPEQPARAGVRP